MLGREAPGSVRAEAVLDVSVESTLRRSLYGDTGSSSLSSLSATARPSARCRTRELEGIADRGKDGLVAEDSRPASW